ncbi:hypothetical protein SanaruYs_15910 [Chryseotalea sanaruensis]|uniref:Uncharacterized protein n=1 Tax=Chryseotalea sanaruensis TaxID=2482724 RepID=A0A401U901_9BACT|nr:outer membrane beta-barrel protein [Chryseotalea sanaruensis]GCC51366.1 hypothetical protein SanaruYs_15910 [Chryseotalea sanaruensis]
MKNIITICAALLIMNMSLFAQQVDPDNYKLEEPINNISGYFYLGLETGIPGGQLKQNLKSDFGEVTFGFSSGLGLNPFGKKRESPLLFGIDFSIHTFGRDKTTDPVTDIRYKTSYNKFFVGPVARIYFPVRGKLAIFAEGMAGAHVMNSRIKIDQTIFDNNEEEILIDSENDGSLGYGFGVGLHTRKQDSSDAEFPQAHASFFMRLSYLSGDRSRHIERGSVSVIDDVLTYRTAYTDTGLIQLTLGVILY